MEYSVSMTNKKIALFLSTLNYGGAERVVVNLANGFVEMGLDVDIVVINKTGALMNEVSDNVDIVEIGKFNLPIYKRWGSLPGLVRYLTNRKPDAMISTVQHRNLIAIIANYFAESHTRVYVREGNNLEMTLRYKKMWRVYLPLIKLLYPKAQKVIANSRGVADSLQHKANISSENIVVINNPTLTPDVYSKMQKDPDHPWFDTQYSVILGVGSLTRRKSFSTLIKSIKQLDRPNTRLIIIGEGPERSNLEQLISTLDLQHQVDLIGTKSNPYSFMNNASVFVLSSVTEGFPNVLVEAMACGTPIVSTNCPSGPEEILECGKYGILVPVGDPDKMAMGISEQLEHPTPATKLQERARRYHYDVICEEYLQLIEHSSKQ